MKAALFAAILFIIIIMINVLLICGFPLGEFTLGGKYKIFPKKLRIVLVIQLILQMFFVIIVLQAGRLIPLWFSYKTTRMICIVMAAYLSLNVVMNFISKSKKEKYIMTPLSLLSAICFWITAYQM